MGWLCPSTIIGSCVLKPVPAASVGLRAARFTTVWEWERPLRRRAPVTTAITVRERVSKRLRPGPRDRRGRWRGARSPRADSLWTGRGHTVPRYSRQVGRKGTLDGDASHERTSPSRSDVTVPISAVRGAVLSGHHTQSANIGARPTQLIGRRVADHWPTSNGSSDVYRGP